MPRQFDRERSKLGQTLIRLRKEHGGVSQKALSRLTKGAVKDSHIAQMETGDRGASLETLNALAAALGLNGLEYQELLEAAGHELSNEAIIVKFREDFTREVFVALKMLPSGDEEELLSAYGTLDPEGREIVLEYARTLVESRKAEIEADQQRRTEEWIARRRAEIDGAAADE